MGGGAAALATACAVSCLVLLAPGIAGAHGSCGDGPHRHQYGYGHDDCRHDDHRGGSQHHDDHPAQDSCTVFSRPVREAPTKTITGTPGPDLIVGTNGPDLIYGLGGDDKIFGGRGDDHIVGGPGEDRIDGGNDDDNLWGGPGDDRVSGGNGRDHVVGDNGEDQLDGGAACDDILGGSGDDELEGGPGADQLDGDNSAPAFGFGTQDFCDGGPQHDVFVNCELF